MVVDIGDRLREARERIGMTQLELAEKDGVHVATATLWENRRNRRPVATKHIHKLAEVLGIRVSELLGEETRELSATANTEAGAHPDDTNQRGISTATAIPANVGGTQVVATGAVHAMCKQRPERSADGP